MLTLIDFIKNVEDEVFEKVLFYTRLCWGMGI